MSFQEKMLEKHMYAGLVTSLNFHSNSILLVGHGPYLKVYNVQTGQLLTSECILPANRIHRIVNVPQVQYLENNVQVRQIAVYGSKYLSILELRVENESQATVTIQRSFGPFHDWIMDAQWFTEDDETTPTTMAFVFAHNNFALYDLKDSTPSLLYSVQCDMRCILYSARIFGSTKDTVMVASGTVFNEVHLWKPYVTNDDSDAYVTKKLIGHEGVIFGLRFNDDATQLISVSDDRTIRVWQLTKHEQPLVLFGHTARIWDCQFVDEYLVSISEDATCRVWKNTLITPPDEDDNGECIACWEGHASKNVWSCAINPEHKIVATGGQDSGIRLWSLLSIKNNKIDSEEDLVPFPLPEDRRKDNIRNFVVIKNRWIVAATLEGYLLKCDSAVLPHQWQEIQHDVSYKNYAIMKNSECGRVVIVGNIVGELVIISPSDAFEPIKISAHKQKLFEIFIESSSLDKNILHVISNGYNDSVLFHRLDLSTTVPTIRTLFNFEMPQERTTVMSLSYAEDENILICGSRESALLIYRLPCYTTVPEDTMVTLKPALQLRKSHGKQAITSVLIKKTTDTPSIDDDDDEEEDEDKDSLIFWTTGRDGCYIQYRLRILSSSNNNNILHSTETKLGVATRGDTVLAGQDMLLEKLYRNRVTKGTLEGAMLLDNELLLMGFFRKHFFVYNEKKNFVMVAIHCGGGHRRWGFTSEDAKLSKSAFAFIRKEVLYVYFRDTSSMTDGFKESILQRNYHGRDGRALRFLPSDDSGVVLFATSGEDTILKIHQCMGQGDIHTHVNIRKHTTVIKSIDYSQGLSTLLFTSGGLEEFRCWKMETQAPKTPGGLVTLNCLEVATCPTLTADIESRIMDTAVFAIDAKRGLHILAAVYSDAMIRVWLFNEVTRMFALVADGTWHAKCILQVSLMPVGDDHVYLFTSATDGRVAVWDIRDSLYDAVADLEQLEREPTKAAFRLTEPSYHFRVHMSGVNALDTMPYKDDTHILVVTGGEDNAVSATVLEIKNKSISAVNTPFIIPNAHASSVTGIKCIDDAVFTISTDQRLNKWKVHEDGADGVTLQMENATFMDVPDPSALDGIIVGDQVHIATTGIGLQSVKYNRELSPL